MVYLCVPYGFTQETSIININCINWLVFDNEVGFQTYFIHLSATFWKLLILLRPSQGLNVWGQWRLSDMSQRVKITNSSWSKEANSSPVNLTFIGPCIIVIVEEWKTNLMSLAILFHFLCAQHVSSINISIIRSLRLCWWITTSVVLFSVRCVLELWCGWF